MSFSVPAPSFQAALSAISSSPTTTTTSPSPSFQTFSSSSTVPSRRTSISYSEKQRTKLEEFFHQTQYQEQKPGQIVRLSYEIGLTKEQIRGWLRNRRRRGSYKGKTYHPVEHVLILEWVFTNYSKYPCKKLKKLLSSELSMTYAQIKIWFQSRRQRGKPIILTRDFVKDPFSDSQWSAIKDRIQNLIAEEMAEERESTDEGTGGAYRRIFSSPPSTMAPVSPSTSLSSLSFSSPISSPSTPPTRLPSETPAFHDDPKSPSTPPPSSACIPRQHSEPTSTSLTTQPSPQRLPPLSTATATPPQLVFQFNSCSQPLTTPLPPSSSAKNIIKLESPPPSFPFAHTLPTPSTPSPPLLHHQLGPLHTPPQLPSFHTNSQPQQSSSIPPISSFTNILPPFSETTPPSSTTTANPAQPPPMNSLLRPSTSLPVLPSPILFDSNSPNNSAQQLPSISTISSVSFPPPNPPPGTYIPKSYF